MRASLKLTMNCLKTFLFVSGRHKVRTFSMNCKTNITLLMSVTLSKNWKHLSDTALRRYNSQSYFISDIAYHHERRNSYTMNYSKCKVFQVLSTQWRAFTGAAEGRDVDKMCTECDNSLTVVENDPLPVSDKDGDWVTEMEWIKKQESRSVLLPPKDESDIDVLSPQLRPSFNLAAYVNKSHSLQELVKLGVDLSKWEKRKGINSFILKLDFEKDMKQHLLFLHNAGVAASDLGRWLTINPLIFKENFDDLQARINYLESMKFTKEQISRIVSRSPYWLLFSTLQIDARLGYFQQSFELTGPEVRLLATKQPRLITYSLQKIKKTSFAVLEEMGFNKTEMKSLLLSKPKIWMAHDVSLFRRFDFAHNHMGLSHLQLAQFPQVLMSRDFRLKQRHNFLKLLGRNQYDPCKPNYVSPKALVSGTDAEFCIGIAKASVQDYNDFLKTM